MNENVYAKPPHKVTNGSVIPEAIKYCKHIIDTEAYAGHLVISGQIVKEPTIQKVTKKNLAKMNPKLGEEKDDEGRASEG